MDFEIISFEIFSLEELVDIMFLTASAIKQDITSAVKLDFHSISQFCRCVVV